MNHLDVGELLSKRRFSWSWRIWCRYRHDFGLKVKVDTTRCRLRQSRKTRGPVRKHGAYAFLHHFFHHFQCLTMWMTMGRHLIRRNFRILTFFKKTNTSLVSFNWFTTLCNLPIHARLYLEKTKGDLFVINRGGKRNSDEPSGKQSKSLWLISAHPIRLEDDQLYHLLGVTRLQQTLQYNSIGLAKSPFFWVIWSCILA